MTWILANWQTVLGVAIAAESLIMPHVPVKYNGLAHTLIDAAKKAAKKP